MAEMKEVAILGAGLAGMTAAYELRDHDLVVLEQEERVGGRTKSDEWEGYWYNAGAQFVWDHRILQTCKDLGLELLGAEGAHSALYLRGKLVEAPNPYLLFLKMPLSLWEKVDFAQTVLKLRRLSARYPNVDRLGMDARPLSEIMGCSTPVTKEIFDRITESGMGLSTHEVSGYIGLSYAIHMFGGDVNATLKAVVGGTQQIAKALREAVGGERVVLGCQVESVERREDGVVVRYRRGGVEEVLSARTCVVALPAVEALRTVRDLPEDKAQALRRMSEYGRVINVACLTNETGPMPWDRIVAMPVVGLGFELFSNNAFFLRRVHPSRQPGGTLMAFATRERAEALWDLPDEEVGRRIVADLQQIFPQAGNVFSRTVVHRWQAYPPFRPRALADQPALRRPLEPIYFCGDYTAQPGTQGAVGSGYYTARTVRQRLGATAAG